MLRRSLILVRGSAGRAEVTVKAMSGHLAWLGVGCPEGKAE